MKTELTRMGRIRLFPLLFLNGCSQSSRFLLQARRIVGSGDENGAILNQYKFTVVYCESVNLIGYIIVSYLPIVNSYASVHIARHV